MQDNENNAAWAALALINAGLAQGKGRRGLVWFLVSLLLGPIATLLIVLLPAVRHCQCAEEQQLRDSAGAPAGGQRAGSTIVIPATGCRSKPGSIAAASSSPMVRSTSRCGWSEPCSMSASMPG